MGTMDSTMEKTLSSQTSNWREGRRLRAFDLKEQGCKQLQMPTPWESVKGQLASG
jgi:hypothetical protein